MTLAPGSSPQGTMFYDTEGIAYVGGGRFVMTEERDRQVVRFTYVRGATLTRADVQTVKLGTTVGNIGLEGVTNDPLAGGFVLVKEKPSSPPPAQASAITKRPQPASIRSLSPRTASTTRSTTPAHTTSASASPEIDAPDAS